MQIGVIKSIGVQITAHVTCHTFVIHLSYICHTFVGIMLLIMLDAMRHIHRTLPGQGDEAGADLGTIRNGADSQQTQDINEAIRRNTKNRMKYNEYTVYDIMIYYI